MDAGDVDFDVGRKFFCALQYIVDHGTFDGRQKALLVLGEPNKLGSKPSGLQILSPSVGARDCSLAIAKLPNVHLDL